MGRMVDQTGLNERLQQHSQRSGMMIGVSMAVVVTLLIGSFTWLFFRLDPFFSDFAGRAGVPRSTVEPVRTGPREEQHAGFADDAVPPQRVGHAQRPAPHQVQMADAAAAIEVGNAAQRTAVEHARMQFEALEQG